MANETILVVDDQPEIVEPLTRRLTAEGYQVRSAYDGAEALAVFETDQPAVVILDLMLPQIDGLTVCKRIRAQSNVPILIISARSEETDVIVGLELGADDYLIKPFRLNELLARIRALLRRPPLAQSNGTNGNNGSKVLQVGELVVDGGNYEVRVRGQARPLTPVEFRLLRELARQPGQVVSRQALLDAVWGYEGYDPSLVSTIVKRLRDKIEPDPANPQILVTVRGFGYKIAG